MDESDPVARTPDSILTGELPRLFGRWTLLRLIARGGMGEVYLAATSGIEGTERPCVVKVIRRDHAQDKCFAARFLDEARIQAQLQHPGVAQVLEAAADPSGVVYIAMEYVEGRNLAELRHRASRLEQRIPWADAVAIGVTLGEALAHVHERTDATGNPLEIAHRDLSPQNVMVSYGGEAKIIDFGTAQGQNRRSHTVSGVVFAKPGYVAPEVANQQPGGTPADLYALGVMLWELMAGKRFLSGTPAEHLGLVASGQRRLPSLGRLVDAPSKLDLILARLTAYQIKDRYPSARSVIGDLVELLQRAPSLADGERGVRTRVARCMQRLYPAEPARSRVEFARLLWQAKQRLGASVSASTVNPAPSCAEITSGGSSALPSPSAPPPADLLAGTRYRLVRELGRGGMGVVYEAEHVDLGRLVALKVLKSEHAQNPAFAQRFRAEARAIAALAHDHLVRVYDFGTTADGRLYTAMERLPGETLDRTLEREKKLDWRTAASLALEACQALEVAHQARLVHRDIKPGNLFVTSEGALKLLDFGIAKAATPGGEESSGHLVLGTPAYMAPEQASRAEVDARTDLYALGIVLYELVTGVLPQSTALTLTSPVAPNHPVLSFPAMRGIPPMLVDTVKRATQPDPEQRFQNASEMRAALAAALSEPERRRSRRRRVASVVLTLAGLGLLGLAGYGQAHPELLERARATAQPFADYLISLRERHGTSQVHLAKTALPSGSAVVGSPKSGPALSPPTSIARELNPSSQRLSPPSELEDQLSDQESDDPTPAAPLAQESPADSEAASAEGVREQASEPSAGASQSASSDLEQRVSQAEELIRQGQRLKGYHQIRALGLRHGQEGRVLKAWCQAAAALRQWGEAYKVAERWAAIEKSTESRLELARMERALGNRAQAIRIVNDTLKADPDSEPAQKLLANLRQGPSKVARN